MLLDATKSTKIMGICQENDSGVYYFCMNDRWKKDGTIISHPTVFRHFLSSCKLLCQDYILRNWDETEDPWLEFDPIITGIRLLPPKVEFQVDGAWLSESVGILSIHQILAFLEKLEKTLKLINI
ncbi:hypothetical protein [Microcoleus sp. herbarium19]|uniref:hypothetical protein n=1 Tax=Microcoleus sp. herbarium19 TaxID=3055440 RepID=UPI002FD0A30E